MEVILVVIGIIILINVVGLVLHGVGAIFQFLREHILLAAVLLFIAPFAVSAVNSIMSGEANAEEVISKYAPVMTSTAFYVLFFCIVWRLIMRVRVAIWLNHTVFGEAEKFPGGERSLEKELKAGNIRRIDYMYVISVPFLTKHYGQYKALLDSQGAATPKQFAEICAQNPEELKSSEPLMKAVLNDMVSKGDAKEVALDAKQANSEGVGNPLFVSEHPAMASNFVRREISLD